MILAGLPGCSNTGSPALDNDAQNVSNEDEGLVYLSSLKLEYAENFSVDYYEGGYELLTAKDQKLFLVPEGMEAPAGVEEDWIIINRPVENVYLVASAAMDMIVQEGALNNISYSGRKAEDWYITEAADAMNEGKIKYAGKYSKPDYEMVVSGGCSLVIENTMIYHSPEVIEQFENFGIPVLVEYSNYEDHPLGRVEWIKFFGALFDCEDRAGEIFEMQKEIVDEVDSYEKTDLTIAYFYITSNNLFQVRRSADYIPKMIEIGGAKYIFEELGDENDNRSTLNMQAEDFYAGAKDADYLIYNTSIDGSVDSMGDLLEKCELLKDFKAVKEGRVYCTTNDMYQQSLSAGYFIEDIHSIITGDEDELHYLYKLY